MSLLRRVGVAPICERLLASLLSFLIVSVAVSGAARAQAPQPKPHRYTVRVPVDFVWRGASDYDVYSDRDWVARPGLGGSVALGSVGTRWLVEAEAAWGLEALEQALFSEATAELRAHWFSAGARARWTLAPWAEAFGRVALDLGYSRTTFRSNQGSLALKDSALSFGSTVAFGAAVHTTPETLSKLAVGIGAEVGAHLATPFDFELRPSDRDLPHSTVELGKLPQTAPYARLEAFVRF